MNARDNLVDQINWDSCCDFHNEEAKREAEVNRAIDDFEADIRAKTLREAAEIISESEELRDLTDDHMADIHAAANLLRHMARELLKK